MAIIVKHRPTGNCYVLIGTGFGAYKAIMPGLIGGALFPREESQEIPVAAVSDATGNITWFYTEELQVLEVDGKKIAGYLPANRDGAQTVTEAFPDSPDELCPACRFRITADTRECPSCGLTLINDEPM